MAAAVHELERLGDELHVHQAATAELHVKEPGRLLAQLLLHPLPQHAHLLEVGRRRVRAVEERGDQAPHPPPQRGIARHQARPREGLAFPGIGPLAVVLRHRRQTGREAAPLGARPQTQVDGKTMPGGGDAAEERLSDLDRPVIEDGGLDGHGAISRPSRRRSRRGRGRAGRELAAAELAHPHDHRVDEAAAGVPRRAVARPSRAPP